MFKKLAIIFGILLVFSLTLPAQIKDYIPIVKPVLYEQTKETFESIATRFEEENYNELAEIFRSFAMGGHGSGFVYVDADGENYIFTNRHVVSNSEYVNLELLSRNNTKKLYEHCPIIYTDNDIDLAIVKFPENEKVFAKTFVINPDKQVDGKEIWSAGFPGLLGKPMWQFAKGTITNEEAYIDELVSPDITYLIQHSASIDPGNSGGPLLVKDENGKNEYTIVGVNTWSITNRQNTFFAIPAKNISAVLKKAKHMLSSSTVTDSLKVMLERQCLSFAKEINHDKPNWKKVNNLISYSFVANKGWDSFIKVLGEYNEEVNANLEAIFLKQSPIEAMQHSISYRIWNKLFKASTSKLTIEFREINPADKELIGKSKTIKTNFLINGEMEEVEWTFEHGHWKVINYDLDKPLKAKPLDDEPTTETHKKKNYNGSPVYVSVDAIFTPLTFFPNKTLGDNFSLMGIGGALAINFKDRLSLYIRMNSLCFNTEMNNVPDYLTSASVKYLHANTGAQIFITQGKVRPYVLIGFNYMKFTETGTYENTSVTNEFDKYGFQMGLGIKFRIVKNFSFFTEGTYNSDLLIPLLTSDSNDGTSVNRNVSVIHVSTGISYHFKK